jgi:hypothetical protein
MTLGRGDFSLGLGQLGPSQPFDADEDVLRRAGANEVIKLGLWRPIPILRALDQENPPAGRPSGTSQCRIFDELPSFGKAEDRPAESPEHDDGEAEGECGRPEARMTGSRDP